MRCRDCSALLPSEARFCLSCGTRVQATATDSTPDPLFEILDNAIGFQYRIERLLGRGGMGAVYLAHEFALDRDVAIKVLPPEKASAPQMQERFRREARIAARLSHPNIVPLHTFGEVSGLVYFVMGYIAGESLASRLKSQGPCSPEETRSLLVALCDALDYAHRQGIVHRDIKPDNILLDTASGAPLLTDFGIAKPKFAEAELTATGQLIGTPHYMSPEQAQGRTDVDARSDIYSLGVVAYEAISGSRPFVGGSLMELLTQRLTRDAKPLGSVVPDVPSDIAQAVDRCLQRDVAKRWPDARSLRDALLPFDEIVEESFSARMLRISVTMGALAMIALAYVTAYSILEPDSRLPFLGTGILVGASAMTAVAIIAVFGLRSEGMDARGIFRKAFQQPRWWRSWYPRALRRPGDVWSRLPRELRRFRIYRGFLQAYAVGLFLPLLIAVRRSPSASLTVWSLTVAGLLVVFVERLRATRFVRRKTSATAAEASAILTTSTWGGSAWRRPPASALLDGQGHSRRRNEPTPAGDLPASERPTEL